MIPDDAVEAAMVALDESWITDASRDQLRGMMQAVLQAAAPHLMAAAWDEGYDRAESDYYETGFWATRLRDNPYKRKATK